MKNPNIPQLEIFTVRNMNHTLDGPSRTLTVSLTNIVLLCWSRVVSFKSNSPLFISFRSIVTTTGPSELSFRIYTRQAR